MRREKEDRTHRRLWGHLDAALDSYRADDVQNAMRSQLRAAHAAIIVIKRSLRRNTGEITKDVWKLAEHLDVAEGAAALLSR